jgi:hypothetical protein
MQVTLFVIPPGVKGPTLPTGEASCKLTATATSKSQPQIAIIDVAAFTGSARSKFFDQTWSQEAAAGFLVPVKGVGDEAGWSVAQMTVFGYRGRVAFQVTLEPFPLTFYKESVARALVSAMAKALAANL